MNTALSPAPGTVATAPSGILVIDKPSGWTSHDVVAKVRRILKTRKIGHTGTLDPMGTGVLPLCVGDATKLAGFAQSADKVYRITMRLGITTDTQDATGTVTGTSALDPAIDWEARIREELGRMTGPLWQTPPMYAAVKINGEALYKKARRGETVERQARRITIHEISDVSVDLPDVHLTLYCSKGTYVRTVAADLGEALGVGAHLTALSRLACGPVIIDQAVTLEELEAAVREGCASKVLHPDDFLLTGLPWLKVSEYTAQRMNQGISPTLSEWTLGTGEGELDRERMVPGTLCRVYGEKRGFFALVEIGADPVCPARIRRIVKVNAA